MKLNRLGYLIKSGFTGIFTHGLMSFVTVTIMIACLIIMGSFSLLVVNINELIAGLEEESNVIVAFVDENLSQEEAEALETTILAVANVDSAEFVTREQAMENFKSDYDENMFDTIDAGTFRHRFVIQLSDISQMDQTKNAVQGVDGIADVNAHLEYAEGFITARNIVSVISLILIVILIVVSFFIMSNTIKLATFTRREEIAIMKMVGASNSFIRAPFVVEGLTLGVFGGALAFLAEWGLYTLVTNKIVVDSAESLIGVVPFSEIMLPLFVAYMAVGVIVGSFGGSSAIRNYLKV